MICTRDDIRFKLNTGLESALELCNQKLKEVNTIGLSCYNSQVKSYEGAIATSEERIDQLQKANHEIANVISYLQIKIDLLHGAQDAKLLEYHKMSLYENRKEINRLASAIESYKNDIQKIKSELLKPARKIAYKLNKIAVGLQDRLDYNDTYLVDYMWSIYQVLILGKDGNYMLYAPYRRMKHIPGMNDQIDTTIHELFPWFTSKIEADYIFDELRDWNHGMARENACIGTPVRRVKRYDDPDPFMADANDACFYKMVEELILSGNISSISANKLG